MYECSHLIEKLKLGELKRIAMRAYARLAHRQDNQSSSRLLQKAGRDPRLDSPNRWLRSCGRVPRSSRRQPPATEKSSNTQFIRPCIPAPYRPPIPTHSGRDSKFTGHSRDTRERQVADRACEQMSSRSKSLPSSEWWSGRQRQRPSLRGGALAEGECGRIFRDGSSAGREASGARRGEVP